MTSQELVNFIWTNCPRSWAYIGMTMMEQSPKGSIEYIAGEMLVDKM